MLSQTCTPSIVKRERWMTSSILNYSKIYESCRAEYLDDGFPYFSVPLAFCVRFPRGTRKVGYLALRMCFASELLCCQLEMGVRNRVHV
jgi:hypothetical protein